METVRIQFYFLISLHLYLREIIASISFYYHMFLVSISMIIFYFPFLFRDLLGDGRSMNQ